MSSEGLQQLSYYLWERLACTEPITQEFISEVLGDIMLFDKKQKDYGSSNIADFGELGVLIRANDKIARLKNLLRTKRRPANESIRDSWQDLSVYGVIARLVRRHVWR